MESIYKRFGEKAAFFIVYIREAHPSDGWQMPANEREGVIFKQPRNERERMEVASKCQRDLKISIPMLIDDMNDTANKAYSGSPDRLYIVDRKGRIAYKGEPGPRGFKPEEMAQALQDLLERK